MRERFYFSREWLIQAVAFTIVQGIAKAVVRSIIEDEEGVALFLLTEAGGFLLQEDGFKILV